MRGSPEWLDHGEMIAAELRPVTGKNMLLGQGDHAGLARHDGKGSTAATASGGAERCRNRAEKKRKDDGGGCSYL